LVVNCNSCDFVSCITNPEIKEKEILKMADDGSDYYNYYSTGGGAAASPTVLPTASSSGGSWLSNLFAKKEGGTFVGNLIRVVSSNATGGILGQGKNMINADGSYGNGDQSGAASDVLAAAAKIFSQTPQGQKVLSEASGTYIASSASNNSVWLIIIAIMAMIMGVMAFSKK
jgi:hypothetical protein